MKKIIAVLAGLVLGASLAQAAGYSADFAPPGSEQKHPSIMSGICGGAFTPTHPPGLPPGALVYTNGTVTATRVYDWTTPGAMLGGLYPGDHGGAAGSPMPLRDPGVPGAPFTDQFWPDGTIMATAKARYAQFSQEFGYDSGGVGGYTKLFDVSGCGFAATGSFGPNLIGPLFA